MYFLSLRPVSIVPGLVTNGALGISFYVIETVSASAACMCSLASYIALWKLLRKVLASEKSS